MKASTRLQKRVMELSAQLPAITDKQKQWAFDHCFANRGLLCKHQVWCLCCGEIFDQKSSPLGVDLLGEKVICPHCGKEIELKNSRARKYTEDWYYTILTTFKGFQVVRHYVAHKDIYKMIKNVDCRDPFFYINEAVQIWINEEGKETIVARPTYQNFYHYDAWNFKEPMTIKVRSHSAYTPDKYDIDACFIYPIRKVLPIARRNGYTARLKDVAPDRLICSLLKDSETESLIKNRQYELLRYKFYISFQAFKLSHQHSIRIANRNRYIVKDPTMWFDYLNLLDFFHLDTHNAHYVCPSNLKEEHDKLLRRKRRIDEKIALEKKIAKAKEWEKIYAEEKGKYFGICFGNENIMITVIQSVAEMADEGVHMHHCVFDMGYYKKPESLILSAKDREGNRLETIEVNLKTFTVIQSRAVSNGITPYHQSIVNLVKDNMSLIQKLSA